MHLPPCIRCVVASCAVVIRFADILYHLLTLLDRSGGRIVLFHIVWNGNPLRVVGEQGLPGAFFLAAVDFLIADWFVGVGHVCGWQVASKDGAIILLDLCAYLVT